MFLSGSEQLCPSATNVVYNGFCIGVVESDEDNACHNIFMPNSYPIAIKSNEFETYIISEKRLFNSSSGHFAFRLGLGLDLENDLR